MPRDTTPKPFVFVLMPFSPEFDDTYRLAIQPACERVGAFAERVDDQIFDGSILQRIYNQIAKADIVIADLTGKNPNVFYETGYAHALGKRTLLLTRHAEDIPFDLKHFPHIVYEGRLSDLLRELEKRVRWYMENPEKEEATAEEVLVQVNNTPLTGSPCISFTQGGRVNSVGFTIDIHNKIDRRIRDLKCQVGVIAPKDFSSSHSKWDIDRIHLSEESYLHLFQEKISLLPASWAKIELTISSREEIKPGDVIKFAIRVLTASGSIDFPFSVTRN